MSIAAQFANSGAGEIIAGEGVRRAFVGRTRWSVG
jgi:hypothetical protein